MRTSTWLAASAIGLSAAVLIAQTPATTQTAPRKAEAPAAKITIDDLVHIKHPSGHQWTPDGRHVYWTYDDGGINNVWAAAADGRTSSNSWSTPASSITSIAVLSFGTPGPASTTSSGST